MKAILPVVAAVLCSAYVSVVCAQTVLDPMPQTSTVPATQQEYTKAVNTAIGKKDYTEALRLIDEAVAKNPQNVELAFRRGPVLEALGRTRGSEADLRAADPALPRDPRAL